MIEEAREARSLAAFVAFVACVAFVAGGVAACHDAALFRRRNSVPEVDLARWHGCLVQPEKAAGPARVVGHQLVDDDPRAVRQAPGDAEMEGAHRLVGSRGGRLEPAGVQDDLGRLAPGRYLGREALASHGCGHVGDDIARRGGQTELAGSAATDLCWAEPGGDDVGEQPAQPLIGAGGPTAPLPRGRPLPKRCRPRRSGCRGLGDQAGGDQLGEVLADGVVVEGEPLRQLGDPHRLAGFADVPKIASTFGSPSARACCCRVVVDLMRWRPWPCRWHGRDHGGGPGKHDEAVDAELLVCVDELGVRARPG